jgi:hypothetical protein
MDRELLADADTLVADALKENDRRYKNTAILGGTIATVGTVTFAACELSGACNPQ